MKTKHYITTVTIANAIDIEVELELPADYNGTHRDLGQIAVKEALNILRDRVLNRGEYDVDEPVLIYEDEDEDEYAKYSPFF